jgi:3-methyladenine DNA glycosylase AlkD
VTLQAVRDELAALADPERAAFLEAYFRAEPGGDGEGDVLLGIPVPVQRRVARGARDLEDGELAELLASPVHEHRFVALIVLVWRAQRAKTAHERAAIARFYLDHRAGVNHWDLVDVSAAHLLGDCELETLEELAASERVWDRRMAIVATHALIRRGDNGPTFLLAEQLLGDSHHLIHKAAGWMLREAGKRDEPALVAWLERHAGRMPRTMLRYAVERLDPADRLRLMSS